jgi:hypothetical protein
VNEDEAMSLTGDGMANFVLVHGGWRGGWAWKRVAKQLQNEGHHVYTPTLTGLGERNHLLSASINLSTNIRDIINLVSFEELNGGRMVKTGDRSRT